MPALLPWNPSPTQSLLRSCLIRFLHAAPPDTNYKTRDKGTSPDDNGNTAAHYGRGSSSVAEAVPAAEGSPVVLPAVSMTSLYVDDLARSVDESVLMGAFCQVAPVTTVRVRRDTISGVSLGSPDFICILAVASGCLALN